MAVDPAPDGGGRVRSSAAAALAFLMDARGTSSGGPAVAGAAAPEWNLAVGAPHVAHVGHGVDAAAPVRPAQSGEVPDFEAQVWSHVASARKGGPHPSAAASADPFFQGSHMRRLALSAPMADWYFMAAIVTLILVVDASVLQLLPETARTNLVLLVFWVLVSSAVGVEVWLRMGPEDGSRWVEGFMLELVYAPDRIFVMHLLFSALNTPRRLMAKALFVGVLGAIGIRFLFALGVAPFLERLRVVHYGVGVWLIYNGTRLLVPRPALGAAGTVVRETSRGALDAEKKAKLSAGEVAQGDGFVEDDSVLDDVTQSPIVCALRWLLDSRFGEFYDEETESVLTVVRQRVVLNLLGVVILCLFVIEALFGLDIALVKSEALNDPFLELSSAVTAAFVVRAMFLVVRDTFNNWGLSLRTLGTVLFFFGTELLVARVVRVSAVFSAFVAMSILASSTLVSWFFSDVHLKA